MLAWPMRDAVPRRGSAISESGGSVAAAGARTARAVALDEEVTADRAERPDRWAGLAVEGFSGVVPAVGAIGPADTVAASVVVPSAAAATPSA